VTDDEGWTRVDTHVKVLDDDAVERAKARGIDVLVYAPHFTRLPEIRRRAETYSDGDLLVVPGREVFTGSWHDRKHVLVVDPDRPIPDFVTLEGVMRTVEKMDAAVIVPHPEFFTVGLSAADVREYRAVVDAVEVYNPKHWPRHTYRARAIAEELSLPRTGGSYAHLVRTVGAVWTAFDRPIADPDDLVDAIGEPDDPTEWEPRRVEHFSGPGHALERVTEFCHLGWENTYQKADRVFLRGIEATHPRHVAYQGQYDDIAVY